MAAYPVSLVKVDNRRVQHGVALVRAGHVPACEAANRQLPGIQVGNHNLLGGVVARPELDMAEGVLARAEVAGVEPLAQGHDAPAAAPELAAHVIRQLFERQP